MIAEKAVSPRTRPNVLLILTDDQGWDDLGCHGNSIIETPRLDCLAAESVQFDNFYVAPVCAPTRASLLTGRHFLRTGVSHVHGGRDFVHPGEIMLQQMFRQEGYRTGMWGKWHSGKTTGYFPWERGFDEAYMARLYRHRDNVGRFNGAERAHAGWTVDTITDYAVEFMHNNRGRPWFAFVPYLTVHAPLAAPDALVAKYRAKGCGDILAKIYAMIEQMDAGVGRMLDVLDELKLADDTIVVFLSDNGPQCFEDMPPEDVARRYVSRYKGHKGSMWENGIKAPLFVRHVSTLAPRYVRRLCDVCDVFPTLLDLCGITVPRSHPVLDGQSVRACLEGSEEQLLPRESVIFSNLGWPPEKNAEESAYARDHEYENVSAQRKALLPFDEQLCGLRSGQHKLLLNPGYAAGAPAAVDRAVLIRIERDPLEDANVASSQPAVADGMREELREWFAGVLADPHSYHNPVFALGPGTSNVVLCYAAQRTSDTVRIGVHETFNWRTPGDFAEYLVDIREGCGLKAELSHGARGAGCVLHISVGGANVRITTNTSGKTPVEFPALAPGVHTLRVELQRVGPEGPLETLSDLQWEECA